MNTKVVVDQKLTKSDIDNLYGLYVDYGYLKDALYKVDKCGNATVGHIQNLLKASVQDIESQLKEVADFVIAKLPQTVKDILKPHLEHVAYIPNPVMTGNTNRISVTINYDDASIILHMDISTGKFHKPRLFSNGAPIESVFIRRSSSLWPIKDMVREELNLICSD